MGLICQVQCGWAAVLITALLSSRVDQFTSIISSEALLVNLWFPIHGYHYDRTSEHITELCSLSAGPAALPALWMGKGEG